MPGRKPEGWPSSPVAEIVLLVLQKVGEDRAA